MHHEDDVRVSIVRSPRVTDGTGVGIPVQFGVGRRDRAVRIHGVHYFVSAIGETIGAFLSVGIGLSENPEHENTPIAVPFDVLVSPSSYGVFFKSRLTHITATGGLVIEAPAAIIPLYGILRPFRQILLVANDLNATISVRAEIYYTPVTDLNQEELKALDRQKGGYRRT